MSYTNTFIQIPDDSTAVSGVIPTSNRNPVPMHLIQYQLLTEHPYTYNHEELTFAVHVIRQGITDQELQSDKERIWTELFQKGHPCMRASALTKKYGWGAHYNEQGKIALYAVESDEYKQFIDPTNGEVNQLMAMRSKRR